MPKIQDSGDMRVALLYPTAQHGGHLREALNELGAAVVYETAASSIDRDALENSGARTVIVNLGPDSDDYIDELYDVLDAGDYNVVFNEANVTEALQGWDHARWARNLAAKILSRPDVATPPRPPGAEAVPTPVQKSASNVPVADKPSDFNFPPVEPPTRVALKPVAEKTIAEKPAAQKTVAEEPVSERPTMEMPLPEEFRADEPVAAEGMDVFELAEFAEGAHVVDDVPAPLAAEPVTPPPAEVQERADDDFAAELDALFAAADNVKPVGDELDIGLPADFDLADISVTPSPGVDEAITLTQDDISAPSDAHVTELHDEFPAIFDQLDVAAASVPPAVGDTFRLAARPEREENASAEPLLPPDWSLDDLSEESTESAPAAPFGIEKVSAEEYFAPTPEENTAKQKATLPKTDGGLTLELMPMEEAVAPQQQSSNYESEAWLDGSRPAQKIKTAAPATASSGVQKVFVLGASIGGPEAVRDFLGALPAGFPMLFILAQHMGEEFLELMSAQLRKSITLTVRNPTHGEHAGHGEVLIVPTTHRLQIDRDGVITLAHLSEKPPYSPSIDLVLRDVADQFGADAGAIVFSGMAHDAIEGSKYLKEKGGVIWVQDPDTCVISSMVDGAREAGIVSFTGSPSQLAAKLIADFGHG